MATFESQPSGFNFQAGLWQGPHGFKSQFEVNGFSFLHSLPVRKLHLKHCGLKGNKLLTLRSFVPFLTATSLSHWIGGRSKLLRRRSHHTPQRAQQKACERLRAEDTRETHVCRVCVRSVCGRARGGVGPEPEKRAIGSARDGLRHQPLKFRFYLLFSHHRIGNSCWPTLVQRSK